MKKILLVGGGTGGHVFPLLNLVQYVRKIHNNGFESTGGQILAHNYQFHWIGEADSIESRVADENTIPFSPIICGKLRRYLAWQTFLLPFQVFTGILQSILILHREKPTSIFSKWGYVSLPVAFAGWILRVPIYLHESDSIPGLANRIVGRFATWIFCSFHEADSFFQKEKILGHGTLLSQELIQMKDEVKDLDSTSRLHNPPVDNHSDLSGMTETKKTQILVSCGSQGSASIFDAVLKLLETQNSKPETFDWHIILWVKNLDYRKKFEPFQNVHIYDFFYDQTAYLTVVQKCDVVIARSGSSIFEFEALGLHMILIPHPHTGNNHQYYNALAFQKKGHELIEQKNISIELWHILIKYKDIKRNQSTLPTDDTLYINICKALHLS
jgi:UDP-N-acetylglucosamine--N-acetylmuramyl-(pentapeptide) pyrophosphoryl-undecaprenol N-acetylglucosamine transferase